MSGKGDYNVMHRSQSIESEAFRRRFGRQNHHEHGRNRPDPALAGKRGEIEPEDLSGNLIVQLGAASEDLNRSWYERNTGRKVGHVQRWVKHSAIPWMAATLDGIVEGGRMGVRGQIHAPRWKVGRNRDPDGPAVERAKGELKALMPKDAKEAIGHGLRGKRAKSGAVSFDVLTPQPAATEIAHAPVQ
jgi:hypothetical protein